MIARLAELLRYATDSSEQPLVPLREEVAFTQAYVQLEQKRLAERLRVHRFAIVAVNAIAHLESDGKGGYVATLKNGAQVRVSRSRADQIRHLIV